MSNQRCTPEFKEEAVRQVIDRGSPVSEVAEHLGVSAHSLYKWVRVARPENAEADELEAAKLENQRLRAALRRPVEPSAAYFAKDPE